MEGHFDLIESITEDLKNQSMILYSKLLLFHFVHVNHCSIQLFLMKVSVGNYLLKEKWNYQYCLLTFQDTFGCEICPAIIASQSM
jgi:hypothetical protein